MVIYRCIVRHFFQTIRKFLNRIAEQSFFIVNPTQCIHDTRIVGPFFLGYLSKLQGFVKLIVIFGQQIGQIIGRRGELRVDIQRGTVMLF